MFFFCHQNVDFKEEAVDYITGVDEVVVDPTIAQKHDQSKGTQDATTYDFKEYDLNEYDSPDLESVDTDLYGAYDDAYEKKTDMSVEESEFGQGVPAETAVSKMVHVETVHLCCLYFEQALQSLFSTIQK